MKKVTILGLGYIGLPSAVLLASSGFQVNGVDVNDEIVEKVNAGEVHFEEPHLLETIKKVVSEGKLIYF